MSNGLFSFTSKNCISAIFSEKKFKKTQKENKIKFHNSINLKDFEDQIFTFKNGGTKYLSIDPKDKFSYNLDVFSEVVKIIKLFGYQKSEIFILYPLDSAPLFFEVGEIGGKLVYFAIAHRIGGWKE